MLAQLCFNYRDISFKWANHKKIVNKDCNICSFAVMEYTIVGCEGFEIKGFEVSCKGKIPDMW